MTRSDFLWKFAYLAIAGGVFLIDQSSKAWAVSRLRFGDQMILIPGFLNFAYAENTGVAHFFQGVDDKLEAFLHLSQELGLDHTQCAFMGDDVVDLPPMLRSGLAITVPAAPALVKEHAHFVTTREGGRGAVREVCEFIMQAQGTFDAQMAQYLK